MALVHARLIAIAVDWKPSKCAVSRPISLTMSTYAHELCANRT